jgi:hypothetical protein
MGLTLDEERDCDVARMWEPVPVETECDNECGIAGFEGKRMQVQANAGGNSKLNEWECCRAGHQTM